jgi:hypothetical protein
MKHDPVSCRMGLGGAVCCLALAAGCAPPDPLEGLTSADRAFLFADSESSAAFMGMAAGGGLPSCDPRRMNQAYVLVDTRTGLYLDSVRPSGVERHRVSSVAAVSGGFEVKALNGANLPFTLQIVRAGYSIAEISWDGAEPETFLRCETAQTS